MSGQQPPQVRDNPFSTRYVRPGAITYLFPQGTDADSLLRDLEQLQWSAVVVGPHGSGKSTLLATLISAIERTGKQVIHYELHDGQRQLPTIPPPPVDFAERVIVVDGYEQLSWCNRKRLEWRCQQKGWGLLVTSHAEGRLPILFRTSVDDSLAQQIVRSVLSPDDATIHEADVREALVSNGGNLREALFALYDLYELRHSEP